MFVSTYRENRPQVLMTFSSVRAFIHQLLTRSTLLGRLYHCHCSGRLCLSPWLCTYGPRSSPCLDSHPIPFFRSDMTSQPDRVNPLAKFYLKPRHIEIALARGRRVGRKPQVGITLKSFLRCFKFWHLWAFARSSLRPPRPLSTFHPVSVSAASFPVETSCD